MGRRGPLPTVFAVKKLRGNPSKEMLDHREPKGTAGAPTLPRTLTAVGLAFGRGLMNTMSKNGTIDQADGWALECVCTAYADHRQAVDLLAEVGLTYRSDTPTGEIVRAHPAVAIRNDAWRRVLKGLAELGLTPMSRGRVQIPLPPEDVDPLEEFLGPATTGRRNGTNR